MPADVIFEEVDGFPAVERLLRQTWCSSDADWVVVCKSMLNQSQSWLHGLSKATPNSLITTF